MAKINNQAVLQKLMDELKLYPAKDAIPTELAEKILPVYQINSEEVTVTNTPSTIVRTHVDTAISSAGDTIYTVPATGDFYLTNVALAYVIDGAFAADGWIAIEVTIDGVAQKIIALPARVDVVGINSALSLNLQNPVKIDQGTDIKVLCIAAMNGTAVENTSTIIGYTQE
jgi:hypothetical protein